MKAVTILFILLLLSFTSFSQQVSDKNMVGFGCSYSGESSKSAKRVIKLLKHENYDALKKDLDKGNAANQFLAVIALEKLEEIGKIELSASEKERINKIKSSKKKISYCSGCTMWHTLSLFEAFSGSDRFGHLVLNSVTGRMSYLVD